MSDNILFEIQIEIMKRLPVKSLIRFRSVSKAWKSLIDSSNFIAHYHSQQQHLLVRYDVESVNNIQQYVSIVDDDTFPQQRVPVTAHLLVNMLEPSSIIGSSHGVLCLYVRHDLTGREDHVPIRGIAVLWNLSIRKAVAVVVPDVGYGLFDTVLGFGVCRETTDPKIIKITCHDKLRPIDRESISSIPCQVEVFTLSSGVWRRPHGNLPRKSVRFSHYSVVVDGHPYWLATDVEPGSSSTCNVIMSFDTTSEEFREVNLPASLALPNQMLLISKLRESLIVLETDQSMKVLVVWMMEEDGVSRSFTKLFTIDTGTYAACIRGFRNSGEPIFEVVNASNLSELNVYEPYSKDFVDLGIDTSFLSFYVSTYTETLLLLDKPDLTVYNENETFKYRDDLFQELGLLSNYMQLEIGNNFVDDHLHDFS